MDSYLWWAVVGIALVVVEVLTGTFYLLVIGIAAFAGAAASYLGYSFWVQTVLAAGVAVVGVILVNRYRITQAATPSGNQLDTGQSVVFESWLSEPDRTARVRYRDATWEARVLDAVPVRAGQALYIQRIDGNTLYVSAARPV